MLSNLLAVAQQVLILFLMISVGFGCRKVHLFSEETVKGMNNFILYIVVPCVMIHTFQREFDSQLVVSFFKSALFALLSILMCWGVSALTIHDANKQKEAVYRFTITFSNCGFMALPMEQALLGDEGLFYGIAYLAVFNIASWSLGFLIMDPHSDRFSLKKIFLNPGLLGAAIGLLLFFGQISLPSIVDTTLTHFANMNTPLPMVIIGYQLAGADFRAILKDFRSWLSIFERLIVTPAIGIGIAYILGMSPVAAIACMIALSAPSAAFATMFAILLNKDSELSVSLVSLSTLLSIFTMPVMIVLTECVFPLT